MFVRLTVGPTKTSRDKAMIRKQVCLRTACRRMAFPILARRRYAASMAELRLCEGATMKIRQPAEAVA
jgi:hypothetical protein